MKRFMKQVGQGMTEYIIIVALIAIAAIGVYSIFGDTVTDQMGAMTVELSGGQSTMAAARKDADADIVKSTSAKDLGTFEESN